MLCFLCGKKGHLARVCRLRYKAADGTTQVGCFVCGSKGTSDCSDVKLLELTVVTEHKHDAHDLHEVHSRKQDERHQETMPSSSNKSMASQDGHNNAPTPLESQEIPVEEVSSPGTLPSAPRSPDMSRKHPSDLINSIRARWAAADKRGQYDHIPSSGFTDAIARYEHIHKQAKLDGLPFPMAKQRLNRGLSAALFDLTEKTKLAAKPSPIVPPGFLPDKKEAAEIASGEKAYFRLQDVTRNAKHRIQRFAKCLTIPKAYEEIDKVWIVVRFQSFGYEVAEVQDMGKFFNVVFEEENLAWELFDDLNGPGWMSLGPSYGTEWFWVTKSMAV